MAKRQPNTDYFLLSLAIILLLLGVIILTSISAPLSLEKFGNTYYYLKRHMVVGVIPGLVLAFFLFMVNLELLKKWAPLLFLINLILMIIVFLPKIGLTLGGATRWLHIGRNVTFQPSEALKLTFVLYLASLMAAREKPSQTLLAFLGTSLLIGALLILQPNISTLVIILLTGVVIYFTMNTPLWQTLVMVLGGIPVLIWLIILAPYRFQRLVAFLKPEIDPLGITYQSKQALVAVGSGGILGLGLGMSKQKFGFLPESLTDSVFAIFAEETGFLGSVILVFLFLLLLWRGLKIAKESSDKFRKASATGIAFWLCFQSFLSIGIMIGLLPIAGIPLPFISYGGSHLVTEMAGIGILLNLAKYRKSA